MLVIYVEMYYCKTYGHKIHRSLEQLLKLFQSKLVFRIKASSAGVVEVTFNISHFKNIVKTFLKKTPKFDD